MPSDWGVQQPPKKECNQCGDCSINDENKARWRAPDTNNAEDWEACLACGLGAKVAHTCRRGCWKFVEGALVTEMLAAAPGGTLGHQRLIQILHQGTGKEATQPSGSRDFQTQREKLKARFNSQGKLAAAPSRAGKRKHAPSTATSSPSMTTDNEKAVRKGAEKDGSPGIDREYKYKREKSGP